MKKLPEGECARQIPLSHALVALLRVRSDGTFQKNKVYLRLLRRLIHIFSQNVETGVEMHLLADCPQPSLQEKYHPYMKGSRMKGNRALTLALLSRFHSRGGGFVSAKEETSLRSLGILDESHFSNRSATEYCVRLLCKTVSFMGEFSKGPNKVINCCFDLANVSTEQASCPKDIVGLYYGTNPLSIK